MQKRLKIFLGIITLTVVTLIGGCAYTAGSGLPSHLKTIEVNTFGNSTYYNSLETLLTREVINEINVTPKLKVVNSGGDATLTGEIYKVRNVVTEYDSNNQPKTVYISVSAKFSLYDNVKHEFRFQDRNISSSQSSSTAGRLKIDQGESWATARNAAVMELAKTLMRQIARDSL